MPIIHGDKKRVPALPFLLLFLRTKCEAFRYFNSLQKQAGQHSELQVGLLPGPMSWLITFYCFQLILHSVDTELKKKKKTTTTSQGIMSFLCPNVLKSWKLPVSVSVTSSLFCGLQESIEYGSCLPISKPKLSLPHGSAFRTKRTTLLLNEEFWTKFPYAWKSILSFLSWLNFLLVKIHLTWKQSK